MVRLVMVRCGTFRLGRLGAARSGRFCSCPLRYGRQGQARYGRLCEVVRGEARQGSVWQARLGKFRHGSFS